MFWGFQLPLPVAELPPVNGDLLRQTSYARKMVRGPQPGLKEARPAHAGDGVTSQVAHGGQCDVHDAQLIQVVRLLAGKTEAELRAEFDALDADGSGALYPPGRLPNSPARGLAPPTHVSHTAVCGFCWVCVVPRLRQGLLNHRRPRYRRGRHPAAPRRRRCR